MNAKGKLVLTFLSSWMISFILIRFPHLVIFSIVSAVLAVGQTYGVEWVSVDEYVALSMGIAIACSFHGGPLEGTLFVVCWIGSHQLAGKWALARRIRCESGG